MIVLTQEQLRQIIDAALDGVPNETCGLIAGVADEEKRVVHKVHFLTNIDESPEHFSMDPKEQFAAVKDMRKSGLRLLGNFHSHPATPARPSEEDKRLAFDRSASYLILSLLDREAPQLKSFRIQGSQVSEEKIIVTGGTDHV